MLRKVNVILNPSTVTYSASLQSIQISPSKSRLEYANMVKHVRSCCRDVKALALQETWAEPVTSFLYSLIIHLNIAANPSMDHLKM